MRLIDADSYCENICRCNKERCDKGKCPIHNAPTIKAAPVVHGEWENVGDDEELCFRCTNCKAEFSCEIDMRQFAKHCPECGADMRSGYAERRWI